MILWFYPVILCNGFYSVRTLAAQTQAHLSTVVLTNETVQETQYRRSCEACPRVGGEQEPSKIAKPARVVHQ